MSLNSSKLGLLLGVCLRPRLKRRRRFSRTSEALSPRLRRLALRLLRLLRTRSRLLHVRVADTSRGVLTGGLGANRRRRLSHLRAHHLAVLAALHVHVRQHLVQRSQSKQA